MHTNLVQRILFGHIATILVEWFGERSLTTPTPAEKSGEEGGEGHIIFTARRNIIHNTGYLL